MELTDWINAISSLVIAVFATWQFFIYRATVKSSDVERERTEDLLRALTVATLMTRPGNPARENMTDWIILFRRLYSGKTKIFND